MSKSLINEINNRESEENPSYLLIRNGRKYQDPTPKLLHNSKPPKKYWPQYTFGVSADAPTEFQLKKTIINYSKVEHDLFLDYGIRDPTLPHKIYEAKHRPSMLKEYQTYNIKEKTPKIEPNCSSLNIIDLNISNMEARMTTKDENNSRKSSILTISPSHVQVYKYHIDYIYCLI